MYRLLMVGFSLGLIVAAVVSFHLGPVRIHFPLDPLQRKVLLDLRLPRVILAMMVGAALAVTGVLFKSSSVTLWLILIILYFPLWAALKAQLLAVFRTAACVWAS